MNQLDNIEKYRKRSIRILKTKFQNLYNLTDELFSASENLISYFNFNDDFLRITGIIYTKGLVLEKSIYSMIVNGYGQESGALLRQLIEIIELQIYLHKDETRINEVINDKLPSAGNRAKQINGHFKKLRDYLNKNSSHFAFSYYSLRHIVDINKNNFITNSKTSSNVLETNMITLCCFMYSLCSESILALSIRQIYPLPLINRLDLLRLNLITLDKNLRNNL